LIHVYSIDIEVLRTIFQLLIRINYQLVIQTINNKKNKVYLYQFISESITIPKLELFYNNYALEHDFLTI